MFVQVKYLMGLKVPRFDKLQDTCANLVANLNYFNWREYVVRADVILPALTLGSGLLFGSSIAADRCAIRHCSLLTELSTSVYMVVSTGRVARCRNPI